MHMLKRISLVHQRVHQCSRLLSPSCLFHWSPRMTATLEAMSVASQRLYMLTLLIAFNPHLNHNRPWVCMWTLHVFSRSHPPCQEKVPPHLLLTPLLQTPTLTWSAQIQSTLKCTIKSVQFRTSKLSFRAEESVLQMNPFILSP